MRMHGSRSVRSEATTLSERAITVIAARPELSLVLEGLGELGLAGLAALLLTLCVALDR